MLENKVVVITGGGGVLCSAFARELAKYKCKVAVLDINLESAQQVADEIINNNGIAIAIEVDVLSRDSIAKARKRVSDAYGKCDILINGAGGNHPKGTTSKETFSLDDVGKENIQTFLDINASNASFVFNLNFIGTLLPTQEFIQDLADRDGVVLNMSSMSAYYPLTKVPIYSAAKAAISNFTMWLSTHFAKVGVRVNAMAPGFFDTKQNHKLLFNEDETPTERTHKIIANTPMGRLGKVEDLMGTLIYLCDNDLSGFVTGAVIPIDGGFLAYSGV